MVDGMLRWKDDTKNRFKSKIRGVIELMVQRCGLEQVRKFVPEDDQPLMNYIDRQARKLASKRVKIKVNTIIKCNWMMQIGTMR